MLCTGVRKACESPAKITTAADAVPTQYTKYFLLQRDATEKPSVLYPQSSLSPEFQPSAGSQTLISRKWQKGLTLLTFLFLHQENSKFL